MIKRIAIFDFCGTLIKTQTGFEFFRFIYLKEVSIRFKLFYNLYRLLSKISNDYDLDGVCGDVDNCPYSSTCIYDFIVKKYNICYN